MTIPDGLTFMMEVPRTKGPFFYGKGEHDWVRHPHPFPMNLYKDQKGDIYMYPKDPANEPIVRAELAKFMKKLNV